MTKEEKDLLKKALCEMLPYGVKLYHADDYGDNIGKLESINISNDECVIWNYNGTDTDIFDIEICKPVLRSMSSMTDEEFAYLQEYLPYDFTRIYSGKFDLINDIHLGNSVSIDDMVFLLECFNKWHLDYRGLIPMGLALEAPEGMYTK